MLADRESKPGAPRGTEEMGALDVQRVENPNRIGDPRGQRVGIDVLGLVAPALTAVIREDQAELLAQHPSEAGAFRNLERVCEARVEEDRWTAAARVLEIRADAIERIRRVGHRFRA
jgi:hypothetical protein